VTPEDYVMAMRCSMLLRMNAAQVGYLTGRFSRVRLCRRRSCAMEGLTRTPRRRANKMSPFWAEHARAALPPSGGGDGGVAVAAGAAA